MVTSTAAFRVQLSTGLTAGNAITCSTTFVVRFFVVVVDLGVVGFDVVAKCNRQYITLTRENNWIFFRLDDPTGYV